MVAQTRSVKRKTRKKATKVVDATGGGQLEAAVPPATRTRPVFKRGGGGGGGGGDVVLADAEFQAMVDETKTASRFGLTRDEVRAAIAQVQAESPAVTVSASVRRSEQYNYVKAVYDGKAKAHGFVDMVDMMATAHIEIVARCIAKPEMFGREGLKALSEVARQILPHQKLAVKRTLPPGETKEAVLARVFKHLPDDGDPAGDDGG